MQQRVNDKGVKVKQKRNLPSDIQTQKKSEESDVLAHDYNPLENITCKIGDNACAARHISAIQRMRMRDNHAFFPFYLLEPTFKGYFAAGNSDLLFHLSSNLNRILWG